MSAQNTFVDDWGIVSNEVRVLPYSKDGNLIVSRESYEKEMKYRRERIKAGVSYELPTWESLKVYNPE